MSDPYAAVEERWARALDSLHVDPLRATRVIAACRVRNPAFFERESIGADPLFDAAVRPLLDLGLTWGARWPLGTAAHLLAEAVVYVGLRAARQAPPAIWRMRSAAAGAQAGEIVAQLRDCEGRVMAVQR